MKVLTFLSLLTFLFSIVYISAVLILLPSIVISSFFFQFIKAVRNILRDKLGLLTFKHNVATKLRVHKKLQSACACLNPRPNGFVELFLRLVEADSVEYYHARATTLHHAIFLVRKELSHNVHKTVCDLELCRGCKQCSSKTKTLLFNFETFEQAS